MKLINKIKVFVLDKIAQRVEIKTYLGHGDYDIERGWTIGKKFISAEKYLAKDKK